MLMNYLHQTIILFPFLQMSSGYPIFKFITYIRLVPTKFSGNNLGAIYLICAAILFSLAIAMIKKVGENIHVTQILVIRQVVMTLIISPVIIKNFPGVLRTQQLPLHGLRIMAALVAMLCGFTAVIHLPLADAIALSFAKSFFVTIFAIVILHETVGYRRWMAVSIGFIGVVIMLQPGNGSMSIYNVYAIIAAMGAGFVMVLIRYMSRKDRPTTILAYQAIFVGLILIIPAYYYWVNPSPFEWLLLIIIGIISYGAMMFNIMAYRHAEASLLAILDYSRVVFSTLLGFLIFGNLPGWATIIGTIVVVGAAMYTVHRESKLKKQLTKSADGRGY